MLRPWPHQGFYFSEEPHPGKRQQQTKLNGRSTRALGYFKLKELLLLFFFNGRNKRNDTVHVTGCGSQAKRNDTNGLKKENNNNNNKT